MSWRERLNQQKDNPVVRWQLELLVWGFLVFPGLPWVFALIQGDAMPTARESLGIVVVAVPLCWGIAFLIGRSAGIWPFRRHHRPE